MKQHSSIEQLNELSEKGKERLCNWWKPKVGDLIYLPSKNIIDYLIGYSGGFCINYKFDKKIGRFTNEIDNLEFDPAIEWFSFTVKLKEVYPLLSIGQMIEFLGNDWHKGAFICTGDEIYGRCDGFDNKTLCGYLWKSVKEILEK